MSTLIYVETSIPSFYHETRPEVEHQARRQWTREWWAVAKVRDTLVTSVAVIAELRFAPEPKRSDGPRAAGAFASAQSRAGGG